MDGTPMPRRGWGMVIIIAPLLMGAVLRGWGSNGATGGEGIRENAWEKWGKHFWMLREKKFEVLRECDASIVSGGRNFRSLSFFQVLS